MADAETPSRLGSEFQLFARHITRAGGSDYLRQKYIDVHSVRRIAPRDRFDGFLLMVARSGPFGLWLADNYSGLFARRSVVRVKLVLALALLECAPPSFSELDSSDGAGQGWVAMIATGVGAAFGVVVACLVFLPARIVIGLVAPGEARPRA